MAVRGGREVDWSCEAEFLDYIMLDMFSDTMEGLWLEGIEGGNGTKDTRTEVEVLADDLNKLA